MCYPPDTAGETQAVHRKNEVPGVAGVWEDGSRRNVMFPEVQGEVVGHRQVREHRARTLGSRNAASVQHHLQMEDRINNILIFMRDSSTICVQNTELSGADVNVVHSSKHTVYYSLENKQTRFMCFQKTMGWVWLCRCHRVARELWVVARVLIWRFRRGC